jgi:hypothetical protein
MKTRNMDVVGGLMLKLVFCFMEISDDPLHLSKLSLVQ